MTKEPLKFVQILRGFAAVAVLLFHLDGFTLTYFNHSLVNFRYGFIGIDFFFVLTGFIITYVHFKETQHQSSVKKFLLKRFVRVYPFYWLVLIVMVALESPEFYDKPSLRSAIDPTTVDGLNNIIKNIVLYPLPDSAMLLGIAWGLSHAVVFYLLFAMSIKLGWHAAKIIFALWLAAIVLHSFDVFSGSLLLEAVAGSVNIEILIGCVAGYLFVKNTVELKPMFYCLAMAVIVLTGVIAWLGFDSTSIIFTTLVGVVFASLIYCVASVDRSKLSAKPFKRYGSPVLVLMGDAAYSIFLTHIIFIPYLCIAFNKVINFPVVPDFFKNILIIILFFLSIVAGIITYLLVERPLLNFMRKLFRLRRQKKGWI
jgi:exopolysaccharide production protein ExoZ